MYKVTFLLKYRTDLTPEYIRTEWQGSHGELALKLPGLRRYVQNIWSAAPEGHERTFDASVDIYFDDEQAFTTSFNGEIGAAMAKDDLRLFDRSGPIPYQGGVVQEHVMRWEPGDDGR